MSPAPIMLRAAFTAALFFFAMSLRLHSEPVSPDDLKIRPLRIKLQGASLESRAEAQDETRTVGRSDAIRRDLTLQFSLGLDFRGSVYHPNLLEFRLAPDLGGAYRHSTRPGLAPTLDAIRVLRQYSAELALLKQKPYATRAHADRGVTYRDLDFFNRARIDSSSWGVATGYSDGPVPITASYARQTQEVDGGIARRLHDRDDNLAVDAMQLRGDVGQTKFGYQFNRFQRGEEGAYRLSGTNHSLSLNDLENWGREYPRTVQSTLLYSRLADNMRIEENLNLSEAASLEHRHHLRSSYNLAGHRRRASTDLGALEAGATLAHQLYESLDSQLHVEADRSTTRAPTSSLAIRRSGIELAESYRKKLGGWGRLQAGISVGATREHREATGEVIVVSDEAHALADGVSTRLRQPNVLRVQFVTDGQGRYFTPQVDYLLVPAGLQVEIRRIAGGLIANGTTVYVSYTAEAPHSGGYTTATRSAQIRLELFDQMLALYGRLNRVENFGSRFLVLQDIDDRMAGIEVKREGLVLSAEQESFFSTFTSYRTARLNESLTLDRGESGTLTLDLTQSWIRLLDLQRSRRYQSYILRYRAQPLHFLNCTLEGGYRREQGSDVDQLLATGRAALGFDYGKLTVNAGYEFERESYLRDRHLKHFLFLYAKRRF